MRHICFFDKQLSLVDIKERQKLFRLFKTKNDKSPFYKSHISQKPDQIG